MNIWEIGKTLTDNNESFVVATLVQIHVSAPQDEGCKMVVTRKGLHTGTMGGGKVEFNTIKKCQELLEGPAPHAPELVKWNLQRDLGMTCGGEVTILFEHFVPNAWPIAIFGAGHVAQALVNVLKSLNCSITCIDSRPEWLDKLTGVKTICHPLPSSVIKDLDPGTYFVSVTKGHDDDFAVLSEVAKYHPHCPYVGCIGSEIKSKRMRAQLKETGISEDFIQKFKLPMGLPFGNNQPTEIAISITAELLQVRDSHQNS